MNLSTMRTVVPFALLLALGLLAGCDLPGKPNPADKPLRPGEVKDFAKLYGKNCAGCHGKTGRMGVAPPLNDKLFQAIVPESVLKQVISEGRAGTLMPAFARDREGGSLTPEQIDIIVAGLRKEWGGKPDVSVPAPDYLLEDALKHGAKPGDKEAGKKVFGLACAPCHGGQGQGGEQAGAINDPAFLALISDQALRRIVITGRPDLGMPDFAYPQYRDPKFKPLTNQDVNDLVTFLSSWKPSPPANK